MPEADRLTRQGLGTPVPDQVSFVEMDDDGYSKREGDILFSAKTKQQQGTADPEWNETFNTGSLPVKRTRLWLTVWEQKNSGPDRLLVVSKSERRGVELQAVGFAVVVQH